MKKSFITLLFTVFIFSAFSQQVALNSARARKFKGDTIIWRQDSLLRMEDFKAKPRPGAYGMSMVGIFVYPVESGAELLYNVEAVFVKSKSFIAKTSEYTLRHEQVHFNICELYSRMLRKKISETNFKKVKNVILEIGEMYQKINKEMSKEHSKFDEDTNSGMNSAKHKMWEDDIQKRLKELEKYSSISINLANK